MSGCSFFSIFLSRAQQSHDLESLAWALLPAQLSAVSSCGFLLTTHAGSLSSAHVDTQAHTLLAVGYEENGAAMAVVVLTWLVLALLGDQCHSSVMTSGTFIGQHPVDSES